MTPGNCQRAALAEARLSDMQAMLDDLRRKRDEWRTQAQRVALLAAPPAPAEPAPASWWRWLRSTG